MHCTWTLAAQFKGLQDVKDALSKTDHMRLMVNNDCQQTLNWNAADYKPIVKHGQVQPIPPAKLLQPLIRRNTRLPRLFLRLRGHNQAKHKHKLDPLRLPAAVAGSSVVSLIQNMLKS